MERMIRKQLYIESRQEAILKRVARERGVSEAEVVRCAIEQEAQREPVIPGELDLSAWREAKAFMESLAARGAAEGGRSWKRDDAYDR